ncbi:MAG: head GIN domain-containing protein [Bacteroidales bacterium]|jgi:hypothetical protein
MKITVSIILATSMMLIATGCIKEDPCLHGVGLIKEITLTLDSFNSIDLKSSENVVISYGEKQEVVARGHANIIEKLNTRVVNGTWEIALEPGCYNFYEMKIYITIPDLKKVEANGSGDVLIENFTNVGNRNIENNGSGKISLHSVTGTEVLDVKMAGSGAVQCYESLPDLKKLMVAISGSGAFMGFPATTGDCTVKSSGSGNCEVKVSNNLNVTISGSGNVYYKGSPEIVSSDSGSGQLISRN